MKYEVISFLSSGFYAYLETKPVHVTKTNTVSSATQCSRHDMCTAPHPTLIR